MKMAGKKLSDHHQPSSSSCVEKKDKKKEEDEKVAFYKLFAFADRLDMALMITGTIGAIGNGLAQPIFALLLGQLINSFGGTHPSNVVHQVSKVSLKLVYLAVGTGIASLLQMTCWMVTGERQATRIRGLYLKTLLRQDIEFFDTQTTTGEVIGRMSGDTILIQKAIGEKVGNFIQCISTFLGGFIVAFCKGWLLTLVLSASIPVLIIAGVFGALVTSKMASRGQVAYAGAGNVVEQTIGAIRTVQSYAGEEKASEKYDSKLETAYAATVKQGLASGVGIGLVMLTVFTSHGLAVWYGAKLIIDKGYDGGSVINVITALMIGEVSASQVAPSINAFAAGRAAAYKMFETIERKPKIDASDNSGIVLEDIKGEIELKNVYFRYPARPEVQIFAGFSLHVPSGKTAALVGQSGSGKSTVISLLERFYDPDAGEVLIDGVDLKKLRLKWIRANMGLVSQEPILFATTMKENILYGKEDATNEEIRKAIELANAATFIDELPLGVDTMVGEHGTQLSGGQKQRIAIARAILKNPIILLLDEATSALDAESERIVQDALDNAMTNRTTIVVAHRLTTIRNADLIAVVHAGKLVEQGTHHELIKDPEGAYSQLVRMQEGISKQSESKKDGEPCKANGGEELLDQNLSNSPAGQTISRSNGSSVFNGINPSFVDNNTSESGEKASKRRKKVSIKRLAYLNKPEILSLLLGSLGAGLNGITFPIHGALISLAIKIFFEPPDKMSKDSEFWGLVFFIMGLCMIVVIPVQSYFFGVAGGKLIKRIRSLTFKKVVHQDISWFDDLANSSGAIGARLSTDAANVRSLVGDALGLIVQNMTTVIVGLLIAFWANWILALIILAVFPLVGMQGLMHTMLGKGFSADAKAMYEEASQIANDAVGSIRTVSCFGAEDKIMKDYEKKCEGPLRQGVRLGVVSGASFGVSSLALFCSQAFCFYIGAVLIQHGKASFQGVFMVFYALTLSAQGVFQAIATIPDFLKVKETVASIFDILDSKPKIDSSSDEGITFPTVRGDIEFLHVSFNYPTRPHVQIFKDFSLHITSAQTVALVGKSGSGKSTVISLIERFYNPDSGQILLDGVSIHKLKLSWLRQQMGLVSQEPVLFNETIRSNIAYGKKGVGVTEEEIINATKASNAYNFISGLPQGFDTTVGERGVQLSGGQKQRIAIARAILKDPKILLLDEATSALDTESERIVQDALDRVMVNRTTVVVAHRLSTIKGADLIAVVKNGVVAEKGKHHVLMQIRNGVYASLVALQTTTE